MSLLAEVQSYYEPAAVVPRALCVPCLLLAVPAGALLKISCDRPAGGQWSNFNVTVTAQAAEGTCGANLSSTAAARVLVLAPTAVVPVSATALLVCSGATSAGLAFRVTSPITGALFSVSVRSTIASMNCTASPTPVGELQPAPCEPHRVLICQRVLIYIA